VQPLDIISMSQRIENLEKELAPYRQQLTVHPLYSALRSPNAVRLFMEEHVFAVWDFMSLLKGLQRGLTCVELPWKPTKNRITRRFINEIVLGEESDLDQDGEPNSHFEMYINAMHQVGANTEIVLNLVNNPNWKSAISSLPIQDKTKEFMAFTFSVLDENKLHTIASAFTFGREDLIPDMFIEIVKEAEKDSNVSYSKFIWYLERHIEVDGDDHGPISLKMIEELCGDDDQKWEEVTEIAVLSMQKRIGLWDGIAEKIQAAC
jgi:hypothetical protein